MRDFGPTLSPMNAFLTITGIETLHVRMDRHVANAQKVAEFLAGHPRVAWVSYAGLKSSPYYELAREIPAEGRRARCSPSASRAATRPASRLVESVRLFSHLANIGDTRSLILHPASTTHRQLTDEQRLAAGAGPDVVRLSIGLETADDLIRDLDEALGAAYDARRYLAPAPLVTFSATAWLEFLMRKGGVRRQISGSIIPLGRAEGIFRNAWRSWRRQRKFSARRKKPNDGLQQPALGLEQRRPIDLLRTPAGVKLVEDFLGRLEYGVYT